MVPFLIDDLRNHEMYWKGSKKSSWKAMGLFGERTTVDVKCYCGHKQSSHLDGIEICLNGLCICESFGVDKKRRSQGQ